MRIESNIGDDEHLVTLHDILLRVVTKHMMRQATGSQWIDETPTTILRHLLPKTSKRERAENGLYAEVRSCLLDAKKTGEPYSPKYLDKAVKLGSGGVEFLEKIGVQMRPFTASVVSHECVFLLMRAFAARNTTWQRGCDIRGVMTKLAAGRNSRKMTREIEVDFMAAFGFSPCNQKPHRLNRKRLFWTGDPREIAGYLKQVELRCPFNEFLTIALLANAFKLSLRGAAATKLTAGDVEIHIAGKDAAGKDVSTAIPVETTHQQWAIEIVRNLHGVLESDYVLIADTKMANKIVFGLEAAFEKVGFLPVDTDYVLPVLPEQELRRYVDQFFENREQH